MWPLTLLVIGVAFLLGSRGARSSVPPPIPGPQPNPPLPGAIPQLLPTVLTTHMNRGFYSFTALSLFDQPTFIAKLGEIGAQVTEMIQGPFDNSIPGIPGGSPAFEGTLAWQGLEGEPVENLPGITWVFLDSISINPSASVSGMGQGVRYGAIGDDGLGLSGLATQVEQAGQQPWQNMPHPPPNVISQVSQSQALPFEHTHAPQHIALQEMPGAGHSADLEVTPRMAQSIYMRGRLGQR